MLQRIVLENVAIVDTLAVDFVPGLTVLTGETGAGKSILVDAMALAFGQRVSSRDILRLGTDKARIELTFLLGEQSRERVRAFLAEQDLTLDPQEAELLVSREITPTASRIRLNGAPVTREVAQALRPLLLDLHGQHELTSLFEAATHRQFLDALGDNAFGQLKAATASAYFHWKALSERLAEARGSRDERTRRRAFLEEALADLDRAALTTPDEDERLRAERRLLENAEGLVTASARAMALLAGDDGDAAGACDLLDRASGALTAPARHDPALAALAERLESLAAESQALAGELRHYHERLDMNPARLDDILERLDALEKLKRRHGPTLPEVFATRDALQAELETLSTEGDDAGKLEADCLAAEGALTAGCEALTAARRTLAAELSDKLLPLLSALALPRVRFSADIAPARPGPEGADVVTFLFSANPGEPLRPLGKVASGGELSRFLLALKAVLAEKTPGGTLVFDEIDTGVSGQTAKAVGEALQALAVSRQVLAITHQPIIAAMGQTHLHVEKTFEAEDGVRVSVGNITAKEKRLQVLSRLASGIDTDDEAVERFVLKLLGETAG